MNNDHRTEQETRNQAAPPPMDINIWITPDRTIEQINTVKEVIKIHYENLEADLATNDHFRIEENIVNDRQLTPTTPEEDFRLQNWDNLIEIRRRLFE